MVSQAHRFTATNRYSSVVPRATLKAGSSCSCFYGMKVEAIRAELASTLTGRRVIGTDLGKGISRTVDDGLRLGFRASAVGGGTSSEDIFGIGNEDGVGEDRPGLEELRLAVERRQRTRPDGIALQVTRFSGFSVSLLATNEPFHVVGLVLEIVCADLIRGRARSHECCAVDTGVAFLAASNSICSDHHALARRVHTVVV